MREIWSFQDGSYGKKSFFLDVGPTAHPILGGLDGTRSTSPRLTGGGGGGGGGTFMGRPGQSGPMWAGPVRPTGCLVKRACVEPSSRRSPILGLLPG